MSNDKFRGWCAYICYIQCDIRCMCKKEIHTTIHNIINIKVLKHQHTQNVENTPIKTVMISLLVAIFDKML